MAFNLRVNLHLKRIHVIFIIWILLIKYENRGIYLTDNIDNSQRKKYLEEIVKIFLEKNNISEECDEEYVINFKQKVGRFLAQPLLKENTEVKKILLEFIKDYKYYTKENIECMLKKFYKKTILGELQLDEFYTIYSPIPSEKDIARENSSNFYLAKFLEVNSLESNVVVNLNSLNLFYENEKLKGKTNEENKALKKLIYMENIVLIDDFSGSGKTIKTFLRKHANLIREKKIILYVFHLTNKAKLRIERAFCENNYEKYEIYYNDLSEEAFSVNENEQYKDIIEQFEKNVINSSSPLGYDRSSALVTFFRNCPNNTVSSYWYNDNLNWKPLFPRKENKLDFFGDYVKAGQNILYNLSTLIPLQMKGKYTIKDLIILLFLKENNLDTFVLGRILRYNEKQLQEHLVLLTREDFLNDYRLTDKSLKILKELSIYKYSLEDLSKENLFEFVEVDFDQNSLFVPKK